MIKKFLIILLFIFNNSFACEVIDDLGNKIQLKNPAQRIISLAPDLTEILFAVGAGDKMVGVVKGSDYPSSAKTLPIVATYDSIDAEAIWRAKPDLIVAWGEVGYITQLKKLGVSVYLSRPEKLTDVAKTMRNLGCLAGTETKANIVVKNYLAHYQQLKNQYSHAKKVRVFYQVWPQPLMTITQHSWINEIIEMCGGVNIFRDLNGNAPEVSMEAVVLANPDIIIGGNHIPDWQKQWLTWPQISAVKNHHIYSINDDLLERAGPRVLNGAGNLCRLISVS